MRKPVIAAAVAAGLLAAATTAVQAQAPAATPAPAPAPVAVPEVMPFDIPYGTPITMDQAHKAITAAAAEAKSHNWKMSISVVDPSGHLVAHATMDGTQYASIAISQGKAKTAAYFRRPSKAIADGINGAAPGGSVAPATLSLLALVGGAASEGGFPIIIDGKLIGAIGASGGIASQDGVTSKAGLAALGIK